MDPESAYFLKCVGIKQTPLRLIGYKPTNLTLKQFIKWYLDKGWFFFGTTDGDGDYTPDQSYRSLGDIFRICYNYYPSATFVEVRRHVLKTDIRGHKCPEIKRRIYVSSDAEPGWFPLDVGHYDEFGFRIYYYSSSGKKIKTRYEALHCM